MEIKKLASIANKLDSLGLTKEADILDSFLQKVAEQVATTGVEGAEYAGGRQTTEGLAGGSAVKFYKAKPKSISEFNAFLGALIRNAAADPRQTAFSPYVIKNLPSKADTTWGAKTQAAFKEYTAAAGFPEAGTNWEVFAKKPSSKYEPTMNGIFRFWEDTIAGVDSEFALAQSFEDQGLDMAKSVADSDRKRREFLGPQRDGGGVPMSGGPRPSYDPMNPLADLNLGSVTPESGQQVMVAPISTERSKDKIIEEIKSTGFRGYRITNASTLSLGVDGITFLTSKDGEQKTTMLTQQGPDASFGGSAVKAIAPGKTERSE
jgi:hypothetical protein